MHKVWAFLKRIYWFRILLVLFAICLIDVSFQLGLPSNTTSSNARLGEIDIVSMKAEDIERTLTAYEDSTYLYIKVGKEQYIKRFKEVGITIDIDSAKAEASYTTKNKLVPFSALTRFTDSTKDLRYSYNPEVARSFVEEIASYGTSEPIPALLVAESGRVGVVADIPGTSVDVDSVLLALGNVEYIDRIEFEAGEVVSTHELNFEKASKFAEQANDIIDNPPQFLLGQDVVKAPASNMAEWFEITQNEQQNYQLSLVKPKVDEYIDVVSRELFVPSIGAQVTLLDDQEITRVNGVSGKILDKQSVYSSLEKVITEDNKQSRSIELKLSDVNPGVTYERSYSKTNSGLGVYLKDLAIKNGNFRISVVGIDNPGLRADYRGSEAMVAASTYKLYVGYYVLKQLQDGLAQNADKLPSGRQVDYCLEQMLVISSNSCAHELFNHFGVANINQLITSSGFGSTNIGPAYTSANDLSNILARASKLELFNQTTYDRFLDMLLRQKLKFGIPTGVSPAQTANKTGNVAGYEHDTAIIYGTKGRYVMTIMSNGGRRSQLAPIAREVHAFVESM